MPDSKPSGGRPKHKTEYRSGDDAARNLVAGMRAVLSLNETQITEVKKQTASKHREK